MLSDHFTNTITILRSTTTDRKKTFAPVASNVPAHIQPISDTRTEGIINRSFNEFLMMCETETVIGDKLTDETTKQYEVIGVAKMEFRTGRRHYESTLKSA
jgi:hypothetical protein